MKSLKIIVICALLFVGLSASAAQFVTGNNTFIQKSGLVSENVYAAGQQVTFDKDLKGDLLGIGRTVTVSGTTSEDVLLIGSSVITEGNIGEDARLLGQDIQITSDIKGDAILIGKTISIQPNATVGGDTFIRGGTVVIDGTVSNLDVRAHTVIIHGVIRGNAIIHAEKIVLENSAHIIGSLTYKSPETLTTGNNVRIEGDTSYSKTESNIKNIQNLVATLGVLFIVAKLIGLIFITLLFSTLLKHTSARVVHEAFGNPGKMIVVGFFGMILIPILALLLIVTVIGIPLGLILLLSYGALLILSGIFSGVMIGALLFMGMNHGRHTADITVRYSLLGVLVLTALEWIPIFGGFIILIITALSFGTFLNILHSKIFRRMH